MDLISFACFNVCALFPSFYVSPTELSSQKMMYLLSNSWFLLRLLINMDIRYSSPFWGQEAWLIPHENPYIITNKQDLFSRCKVGDIIKSFVILNCCSETLFFNRHNITFFSIHAVKVFLFLPHLRFTEVWSGLLSHLPLSRSCFFKARMAPLLDSLSNREWTPLLVAAPLRGNRMSEGRTLRLDISKLYLTWLTSLSFNTFLPVLLPVRVAQSSALWDYSAY